MFATQSAVPVVGQSFLGYLERRLNLRGLYFTDPPAPILDGWETYVYRFRLGSRLRLPAGWRGPLILRVYPSVQGLAHLRHEYQAQVHLRRNGFPVARPLLAEESLDLLGGPFLVMECLEGRTLLDLMLHQPWRIVNAPRQLACEQARLHELDPSGFPEPEMPFPDNHLAAIREQIDRFGIYGLERGLEWLCRHRPPPAPERRILHLDYHPLNVLWHHGRCSGVLDWSESAFGDREADVATTLVLLQTAPVGVTRPLQRLFVLSGRWLLWRLYLANYRRRLPLDERRLSYYVALAALRRLACAGVWLRSSPRNTGCKPSSIRHLNTHGLRLLEDCFRRQTGIEAVIE